MKVFSLYFWFSSIIFLDIIFFISFEFDFLHIDFLIFWELFSFFNIGYYFQAFQICI